MFHLVYALDYFCPVRQFEAAFMPTHVHRIFTGFFMEMPLDVGSHCGCLYFSLWQEMTTRMLARSNVYTRNVLWVTIKKTWWLSHNHNNSYNMTDIVSIKYHINIDMKQKQRAVIDFLIKERFKLPAIKEDIERVRWQLLNKVIEYHLGINTHQIFFIKVIFILSKHQNYYVLFLGEHYAIRLELIGILQHWNSWNKPPCQWGLKYDDFIRL